MVAEGNGQMKVGDVRFTSPPPHPRRVADMSREEVANHAQGARFWFGLLATLDHYGVQRVADLSTTAYLEVFESVGILNDFASDDKVAAEPVASKPSSQSLDHLPVSLRIPEVATVLDISEWEVRAMIKRRDLRHIRLGRLIRVPREALAELLNGARP